MVPASLDEMKVLPTRGDGHCFIYAIVSPLWHQLPFFKRLDHHEVKCALFQETLNHIELYKGFCEGKQTIKEMNDYIMRKVYDNVYGDLVPHIFSNAMGINVKILEELSPGEIMSWHTHDESSLEPVVTVFKKFKHYSTVKFVNNLLAAEEFSVSQGPTFQIRALPEPGIRVDQLQLPCEVFHRSCQGVVSAWSKLTEGVEVKVGANV